MQGKNKGAILDKLGIKSLNPMQIAAEEALRKDTDLILLSPTGSGKTLAFLLPLLEALDPGLQEVQALILVPSRELALQIEQVFREMGSGYKAIAVYGGRAGAKDKAELKHTPTVLIGTPGRIADHIRRENVATKYIHTLILDEFDKSLEVGFEKEMNEILSSLQNVHRKILTSATQELIIPNFVGLEKPVKLNFLGDTKSQLKLQFVLSQRNDKRATLVQLIQHLGQKNGIIFCNFKDSIQQVSDALQQAGIAHGRFHGGLEQRERERALIKFRNGTYTLLVATDLAARGIDVPEMDFIAHYELPPSEPEFIHRNGRSARMHSSGTAYVLYSETQRIPSFIQLASPITLQPKSKKLSSEWETLFISGGRKDKISKGDVAGLFFKQGDLSQGELGRIELKQDCCFVSVPKAKSNSLIKKLNNSRLKKKKVRVSLME